MGIEFYERGKLIVDGREIDLEQIYVTRPPLMTGRNIDQRLVRTEIRGVVCGPATIDEAQLFEGEEE